MGLPGYAGSITFKDIIGESREVRFDLFQGKLSTQVVLGRFKEKTTANIILDPFSPSDCTLSSIDYWMTYEDQALSSGKEFLDSSPEKIARTYSPFLVVRGDQYSKRSTDLPLEIIYDIQKANGAVTIRYTLFFSDEDSKTSKVALEGQMARYGRSTDIEWIYKVTFREKDGEILDEQVQGDFFEKLNSADASGDHAAVTIKGGKFFPGTSHRIFYNQAKNNVFSISPMDKEQKSGKYIGYHLPPVGPIHYPDAREKHQIDSGWMNLVSWKETILEGKGTSSPDNYLFAEITGILEPSQTLVPVLFNGAFSLNLTLTEPKGVNKIFKSVKSIDRLGEDMHWVQATPALKVGLNTLEGLSDGTIRGEMTFKDQKFIGSTKHFHINSLKLFRLLWNATLGKFEERKLPESGYKLEGTGFDSRLLINP